MTSVDYLTESLRIERVIGSGAMALVLEVTCLTTGRRLAAKLLHPKHMSNEEISRRFGREWEAIAQLRSPHLPAIYGYGTNETGQPYILMEYLEGEDLESLLAHTPRLPVGRAARYVREACEGLAVAHEHGVVHRDLKPANLFLARSEWPPSETVKVLDFGISKLSEPSSASKVTSANMVMGTPHYMSPEQVRSSTNVTPRSDVWALGVVLFELVTGEEPFDDETTSGILSAILTQPPRRLSAVFGEVPEGLYPVIARCLEKDPSARYASARELAEALAPFCTEASFDESDRLLFAEPLRERMRERDGGSSLPPASRRSACEAIELLPTERPPTEDELERPSFTTIPVPALPKR